MTAYISTGITVTFSGLSAELLDVNVGDAEAETHDATHQLSTDDWREHIAGLKDGGETTLLLHFGGTVPEVGTAGTLTIAFPNASKTLTAEAILKSGGGVSASLGEKMTQNVGFKISGEPAWS